MFNFYFVLALLDNFYFNFLFQLTKIGCTFDSGACEDRSKYCQINQWHTATIFFSFAFCPIRITGKLIQFYRSLQDRINRSQLHRSFYRRSSLYRASQPFILTPVFRNARQLEATTSHGHARHKIMPVVNVPRETQWARWACSCQTLSCAELDQVKSCLQVKARLSGGG